MNKQKGSISTFRKISAVIKLLFGTAARKYPAFFVLEVLRTLIGIVSPFIALYVTPRIVDELTGDRDVRKLITLAAVLVLGEFATAMAGEIMGNFLARYQTRLENYFTMLIGEHAMHLDFQLTEDKNALDQLEKARTGMSWYSGGVYGIAEQIFSGLGNLIKSVGFIVILAARVPLLLIVMAAYVGINAYFAAKRNEIDLIAYGKLSKVNRLFGYFGWEVVDPRYGKDIRLYHAEEMMTESWKENTRRSITHWKWQADTGLKYMMGAQVLGFARSLITYFYVGLLALRGVYSIGTFTQLVQAAGSLDGSLGTCAMNLFELMKRCNYAYEYVLFMEYPSPIPKGDTPIAKKEHVIEFRDVSFAYPGTEKKVLDHVNITITPGEHLSIVGLNGAGKTTFIKLLCRLYDPTEGVILVDGSNIRTYDYAQYMEQFAPVFQDFKLFAMPIGENITLEDDPEKAKKAEPRLKELIGTVGLGEMTEKLPKGTDTEIFKFFDEEGIEPSGGEQQKIAIARALYKDSPVLILDEPTAALDPKAEYEIYHQFNTLAGGKTALYISHRLSSCRFCDAIAVFSDGKIREYGTHDELVARPGGLYAKMYEAQAKYYR